MDKKELLDIMEFYMFDDIVKKRTSVNGNTYFFKVVEISIYNFKKLRSQHF